MYNNHSGLQKNTLEQSYWDNYLPKHLGGPRSRTPFNGTDLLKPILPDMERKHDEEKTLQRAITPIKMDRKSDIFIICLYIILFFTLL